MFLRERILDKIASQNLYILLDTSLKSLMIGITIMSIIPFANDVISLSIASYFKENSLWFFSTLLYSVILTIIGVEIFRIIPIIGEMNFLNISFSIIFQGFILILFTLKKFTPKLFSTLWEEGMFFSWGTLKMSLGYVMFVGVPLFTLLFTLIYFSMKISLKSREKFSEMILSFGFHLPGIIAIIALIEYFMSIPRIS